MTLGAGVLGTGLFSTGVGAAAPLHMSSAGDELNIPPEVIPQDIDIGSKKHLGEWMRRMSQDVARLKEAVAAETDPHVAGLSGVG